MESKKAARVSRFDSRNIVTLLVLFVSCVAYANSIFFAVMMSVPQTDEVLMQKAAERTGGGDILLAQLQTDSALSETRINPAYWEDFVQNYNKSLYQYSSIFKVFDDEFHLGGLGGEAISIADVGVHYYNDLCSTGGVFMMTNHGMTQFDDESIIITKSYANSIISLSTEDGYSGFEDLYDYPVIIASEGHNDTYYVSGVYDDTREIKSYILNAMYGLFGRTFLISHNSAMEYGAAKVFLSVPMNYANNMSALSLLRKIKFNCGTHIQFPDIELNRVTADDILLTDYRDHVLDLYHSGTNITFMIVMWVSTIFLGVLSVDAFFELYRYASKRAYSAPNHLKTGFGTLLFFTLFSVALGTIIHVYFFSRYSFHGLVLDSLFATGVNAFFIAIAIQVILILLGAYRIKLTARVKHIPFFDGRKLIDELPEIKSGEEQALDKKATRYSKTALLIGGLALPSESAGANRIKGTVKLLNSCGYNCYVSGYFPGEVGEVVKHEDGYSIIPYYDTRNMSRRAKYMAIFRPKKAIAGIVDDFARRNRRLGVIYIYGSLAPSAARYLVKYTQHNGIRLIFDAVEFQVFSQQRLISFFSYYLPNQITNRCLIKAGTSVISISSYLDNYFRQKKADSILIPYVNVTDDLRFIEDNAKYKPMGKTVFLYAGSPFERRDLLAEMIRGFLLLSESERKRVIVLIAGITAVEAMYEGLSADELERASSFVSFLGRVPHDDIEKLYAVADYSLLLKPEGKRFSSAGFPTKLAESWGHGVPIIANLSSDLKEYLVDGYNGFISASSRPQDFAKAIASALEEPEYLKMRKEARRTSLYELDYQVFVDGFRRFLKSGS